MTTETETILTADVVCIRGSSVLLVERRYPPHAGQLALPGGYVDVERGETALTAAVRELAEETGVRVVEDDLTLVGVYDEPGRDPRGRFITVAYMVTVPDGTTARADDDAAAVMWAPLADPGDLAFDHSRIVADAWLQRLDAARQRHDAAGPAAWVGTHHGHHGGTKAIAVVTRTNAAALPFGWECSCGIGQRHSTEGDAGRSAWRHTHPARWRTWARRTPLLQRLVQPTARLLHPRAD
ncbi:NUDIX hydrolase [Streptomyces sp. NPDC052496]|uniref:NUDIX hydrolase n=1 Tax=Streptomyces sp. NPDC052496 TaxID=3154951 RepID=UPI00343C8575